jgi:hypothetical protein
MFFLGSTSGFGGTEEEPETLIDNEDRAVIWTQDKRNTTQERWKPPQA